MSDLTVKGTYTCPVCGRDFETSLYPKVDFQYDKMQMAEEMCGIIGEHMLRCHPCTQDKLKRYKIKISHEQLQFLKDAVRMYGDELMRELGPAEAYPDLRQAISLQIKLAHAKPIAQEGAQHEPD